MSVPDFGRMYAQSVISPRLAGRLWLGAFLLADTYESDPASVIDELPPIARRLADAAWLERFAARFAVIAGRLESGFGDIERLATCTADEVAIHIIVDFVIDLDDDGALDPAGILDTIPNGPGHDTVKAHELCLRDSDVLLLYNPAFDGIEHHDALREHGHAHLHPREWFEPFADND